MKKVEFGRSAASQQVAFRGRDSVKHFQIRHGEAPPSHRPPEQRVTDEIVTPAAAALLGDDMPGLRPRFAVAPGDRVKRGEVLFTDRRHPEIAYVAPLSGVVTEAAFGPRRTLSICEVTAYADNATGSEGAPPGAAAEASPRSTLLARGFWPAFRSRPFGWTPGPEAVPDAIVVNAVHAMPQNPDPAVVLAERLGAFHRGIALLGRLTGGPVFLCQSPGQPLGPDDDRVVHASFSGTCAAGLAGTQIDRLCPVAGGGEVWSIGYQDVAAIGHYFETGSYDPHRVVAISGPAADRPRLLRTPLGARLGDLGATDGRRALCGDPRDGRVGMYLGRDDLQVMLVDGALAGRAGAAAAPRRGGRPAPLVPTRALETALAVDVLAVPLLRALSVGDTDAARRTGCLALVEEDVAALSRRCTSGADYGALLRRALEDLRTDAA